MDMPLELIIKMLEFANKYKINTLVFSGGEACLHPQFDEICNYLKRNKPNVKRLVIQSNGHIYTKKIDELKVFDSIHLSYDIDSLDVRPESEKNLEIAEYFNQQGIFTYLFGTVHSKNFDFIEKMVENANKRNVKIGFNLCCDTGKNDELLLTEEQRLIICEKLLELYDMGKIMNFTHPFTSILRKRESEEFVGIKGGCTAGIAACIILPNGDVIPCPFLRIKSGNVYEQRLEEIWEKSDVFKILRGRKYLKGECSKCSHLSYCGGCRKVAYERTKDLLGSDPTCFKKLYQEKNRLENE